MDAQTDKVTRRRRRAPQRRLPAMVEQRERKPFLFGWGAGLSARERESVKERIALFAGIVLALVVGGLLTWGVVYDNVIRPNQIAADNNTPIAQVGNYTVTKGFLTRFEQFRYDQLNGQLQQLQSQQSQLAGNTKKNAVQLQQISQQISQLQQTLQTLPSGSLSLIVDDHVVLQRAATAGVTETARDKARVLKLAQDNAGGPLHFQQFISTSHLSEAEYLQLLYADDMKGRLQSKLQKQVNPFQTEVRARHILVATSNKSLAQRILSQVEHGASFAALAKKYSIDPGSAKKGGDLGYFRQGVMTAPFDQAAFAMHVGQYRLVQSTYGWHIIEVTGRKKVHLKPADFQQAQQTALISWLDKERASMHVQNFVAPTSLPAIATPTPAVIP